MVVVYILAIIFGYMGLKRLLEHRLQVKELGVLQEAAKLKSSKEVKKLNPPTDDLAEAIKELDREFPNR